MKFSAPFIATTTTTITIMAASTNTNTLAKADTSAASSSSSATSAKAAKAAGAWIDFGCEARKLRLARMHTRTLFEEAKYLMYNIYDSEEPGVIDIEGTSEMQFLENVAWTCCDKLREWVLSPN